MHFLQCAIPAGDARSRGVVSRVLPGGRPGEPSSVQTLVACGREMRPLIGADALGGLELGEPLQLFAEPAAREGEPAATRRPYAPSRCGLAYPVWDPHTSAIYMVEGLAILRLSADNTVTVMAGAVEEAGDADGPGGAARFRCLHCLAADGAGSLYLADGRRVRKVQLPRAGPGAGAARAGASPGGGPAAAAAAAASSEAVVSTLPQIAPGHIGGLAFHGDGSSIGSLILAAVTALYRLPLDGPAADLLLLAGTDRVLGAADVRGAEAQFGFIAGIAMDGEGSAYMAEWAREGEGLLASVRRVAADGTVTTVIADVAGGLRHPAILPNGCLAVGNIGSGNIHVLSLGLKLPACHAAATPRSPAAPAGPPPRTLPTDLAALLDRQPDSTADVTIVVGGRTFHAHRALLSARSDYFRQMLGGGFAEGGTQELNLPDADPDAFELWLRFVYTGAADIPAAQAAAVAELADQLLMPELREQAAAVIEASVSASTVAGLLLWAEARGPAFSELLLRLKAWFVENHEAMMLEAAEEVRALMVQSPDLMMELMRDALTRPAKRPRNC